MDRNWELLCAVAPCFLKLAIFYIGDDDEAVHARAAIDRQEKHRDSFFADLWVELQLLVHYTQTWEEGLPLPHDSIARVLELFENRCCISRRDWLLSAVQQWLTLPQYSHLEALERDALEMSDDQLSPPVLTFERQIRATRPLEPSLNALSPEKPSIHQRFYSERRRGLVDRVHELLATHWVCSGKRSEIDAFLLMNSHPKLKGDLEAHFDVWFSVTPSPQTRIKWQESDIFVFEEESFSVETTAQSGKSSSNVSKGKSLKWDIPSRNPAAKASSRSGPWEVKAKGLCNLIQEGVRHGSRRLNFHVREKRLYWTSEQPKYDPDVQDFISLRTVLRQGWLESEKRLVKRYALAYLLASSFLQTCEGNWSSGVWTSSHVSFYAGNSELDISRPYLSTKFEMPKASDGDSNESDDFRFRLHPFPHVLALGLMLLQIYLASPIEAERKPGHPNNEANVVYNIDKDLGTAQKMLERCEGSAFDDYNNAIKACLSPHFSADGSLKDEDFRQQVYSEVVYPISRALLLGYRINVEEEGWLAHVFSNSQSLHIPDTRNSDLPTGSETSGEERQNLSGHPSSPHINEPIGHDLLQSAQINSDSWLADLVKYIHPLLENTIPYINKALNRPGNVRIAILDTGIDLPVSALESYEIQIAGWKDWMDGGKEDTAKVDLDGHGTHCAGLILKVAPKADLYVARVIEKEGNRKNATPSASVNKNIADAIRHAVDNWKVDIISISIGFENDVDEIESAIIHASTKNTIILAAAGNEGANSRPAWPARSSNVMAIHASDGFGNKGLFTANIIPTSDNFTFPGTDVLSFWPKNLGKGVLLRQSGTSCSTPIAAGLAAVVLEIAGLYLARKKDVAPEMERYWRKLRSLDGVRVAFRKMAVQRDGYSNYSNVQPSLYFGSRGYDIETAMGLIFNGLNFIIATAIDRDTSDPHQIYNPNQIAVSSMAAHKPTYLLSPNWDYTPGSGGFVLGSIIANPTKPTRPLNGGSQLPVAEPTRAEVMDWKLNRSELGNVRVGVWLSFLQMFGIGGDVGYAHNSDSSEVYHCKTLETTHFEPTRKFILDSLQDPEVSAYITNSYFKKPVYMITGLKIARGFKVTTKSSKSNDGDLKLGVDTTALGIPIQVGPDVKVVRTKRVNASFKESTDCVFAYRVVRIRSMRAEGQFEVEDRDKGALLHGKNREEEQERGREVFEEDWEVAEGVDVSGEEGLGSDLEEKVVSED
ncbi:hypothetical protein G7Y89_g4593 [Cudoniella acicularis]|uniref:Peptidase S8/S53 domain-containing protein n=1 Tax=Cudoniella acicularis TaxID=354080 RepID=A0A8H4RP52_9HELO|nr:hypothetical protein G7Y89_g4593 [Cudoniella acicularis]